MADWYECVHPWNRVVLAGLVATLVIRGALGSLTIELAIATPLVAASLWVFGWAMMGVRDHIRKFRIS